MTTHRACSPIVARAARGVESGAPDDPGDHERDGPWHHRDHRRARAGAGRSARLACPIRPRAERHRRSRRTSFASPADGKSVLPIVEGKQLSPFQVDVDRSASAFRSRRRRRCSSAPTFDRDRIAYRDVASATNKLTLIAAMLPRGTVSTHTVFCLKTPLDDAIAVVFARAAEQLRRELPGAPASHDPRDHSTDGPPARAAPARELVGVRSARRAVEARLPQPASRARRAEYADINAIAARLYAISCTTNTPTCSSTFPLIVERIARSMPRGY